MKTNIMTAGRPCQLTVLATLLAGLCGQAQAASDVVISQVYGGGGNSGAKYSNDFIELFNRGSAAVDVSNYSVQYTSAAGGGTWQVTKLPALLLQPGQYLLVQEAIGAGTTLTPLPTPDASGTLALSATAGKVLLSNQQGALSSAAPDPAKVLDVVGFGPTATTFETAPTAATSNATAALRGAGGCSDTDNNSADFTIIAPTPRNTASPLKVCGAPGIVALCPASLALPSGGGGSAALTASDPDGVVNGATILSGAVAGISLADFVAADGAGASASVTLAVASSVPVGTYPLVVRFANDQAQSASCNIAVSVQGVPAVTYTIPQIHGSGTGAAHLGQQTTEGVVTRKVGTGYFIQDVNGDGDPSTADGLFIYTGANASTVAVGDLLRVSGNVIDYKATGATLALTEMQDAVALVLSAGHTITPTNIALPNANLNAYQSMLVRFTSPLTVQQNYYLGSRGELSLGSGRLETPTNRYRAGSADAIALAAANAANLIVLDDGLSVTPTVIPYIGDDGTVRAGDTVGDLTGVVDYGSIGGGTGAAFKLQPTLAPVFSRDNPRVNPPTVAAGNIKVASANVLNFFTTFTNGSTVTGATGQGCTLGSTTSASNCRGADNENEFTRQTAKIVGELKSLDADVVGLMEIQNNNEVTVSYLVDQLNQAIGSVTYSYVPKPASTGTDAIRVAMLYKPGKLTLVGGALSDADAINNRPPMAQTFKLANGARFSVIVNHLKSKGSCPTDAASATAGDTDKGDGQGCWNGTRIKQAQRLLNTFVPQVTTAGGDGKVLLIGDFNSYGHEDPIETITATGFVNELERFVRPVSAPYSYVFDSSSGYLDHALASAALNGQVAGVTEWHNNADEPNVIDYNTDGKPQDLYTAAPFRASDHDPVLVSLNLLPSATDVSASVTVLKSGLVLNRVSGQYTGTVTLSNSGATALTGPFQAVFSGLAAGVTLVNASGSKDGSPYLTAMTAMTASTATLAPGAKLVLNVTFANPAKTALSYAVTTYSGTF